MEIKKLSNYIEFKIPVPFKKILNWLKEHNYEIFENNLEYKFPKIEKHHNADKDILTVLCDFKISIKKIQNTTENRIENHYLSIEGKADKHFSFEVEEKIDVNITNLRHLNVQSLKLSENINNNIEQNNVTSAKYDDFKNYLINFNRNVYEEKKYESANNGRFI